MTDSTPPGAPREETRADTGGWISGPSLGYRCDACRQGVHCFRAARCACCCREPEPVPASDVQAGDRLAYDGDIVLVTAVAGGSWWIRGRFGPGVAIDWQYKTRRGRLFRRYGEILHRVAP